jgi:hypothetical protein
LSIVGHLLRTPGTQGFGRAANTAIPYIIPRKGQNNGHKLESARFRTLPRVSTACTRSALARWL